MTRNRKQILRNRHDSGASVAAATELLVVEDRFLRSGELYL